MVENWQEITSKSNASADKKAFARDVGAAIEKAFIDKGYNAERAAELAKYAVAQCSVEGNWGESKLAKNDFNHAGIKVGSGAGKGDTWKGAEISYDTKEKNGTETERARFRKYDDLKEFAADYVRLVHLDRYKSALNAKNPYEYAMRLGKGGYHQDNPGGYAADVVSRGSHLFPEYKDQFPQYVKNYRDAEDVPEGKEREAARAERESETSNKKMGNYLSEMMSNPDSDIFSILLLGLMLLFSDFLPPEMAQQFTSFFQGNTQDKSYGDGLTNTPSADNSKYNGKGQLGGKVAGVSYELPKYSGEKTAGEYFANCANKFIGQREQGGANCGPIVRWTMANTGLGEGKESYWCAGFTSKMYEGTGLYNYTAKAYNFAEQGMATGSYRQGTINGIEVGDTVIYAREGGNHVGIVTRVENGRVTTVEGNSGDKVSEHTRTFAELKESNFRGYVDVSHREQKLIEKGALKEPILNKLGREYSENAGMLISTPTAPKPKEAEPVDSTSSNKVTSNTQQQNAALEQARHAALALQAHGVVHEERRKEVAKNDDDKKNDVLASVQIDQLVKANKEGKGWPPKELAKQNAEAKTTSVC